MAIPQVSEWLNQPNRDYSSGLALFVQYSDNELRKTLLRNGQSPWHRTKLTEYLNELNENDLPAQPVAQIVNPVTPNVVRTSEVNAIAVPKLEDIPLPAKRESLTDAEWNKLPDAIKDLYTESYRYNSRAVLMFNHLHIATSDAERLKLCLQLLSDRSQVNECRALIREHAKTGNTPAIAKPVVFEVASLKIKELFALANNLPTYITKDSKKLDGVLSTAKRTEISLRLEANRTKLSAVNHRIDNE